MRDRNSESTGQQPIIGAEELEEITQRLREASALDDPATRETLRLVETIQVLRAALKDALEDFELIGVLHPRIRERDIHQARFLALREAAQLIRDGAGADRLEQIASAAEAEWTTIEDVAEEIGIDLDALRSEDSQ